MHTCVSVCLVCIFCIPVTHTFVVHVPVICCVYAVPVHVCACAMCMLYVHAHVLYQCACVWAPLRSRAGILRAGGGCGNRRPAGGTVRLRESTDRARV